MKNVPKEAKILLYDIETTPNLAYVWGKYQQDVIAYEEQWYIISVAWKWLGQKTVHGAVLPDFKTYKKDPSNDIEIVKLTHSLFEEADVVIAHNGDSFDQKKSHARMMVHGLTPPSPYKSVDTLKVARKYANFNSNKLADLGEILGIGKKLETGGFSLWKGCMEGSPSAWRTMKKYNKQDVVLLEETYLALRPWIQNHPSMSLLEDKMESCPNCGGENLIKTGYYFTRVNKVQVWKCKDCGAHPRSRLPEKSEEKVELVS